ncbi:MAG: hypothetical protein H6Q05_5111, partial [Acidobacteria bacterium]|nr:hypothetical protein [Acidobacteriota bacterium]
MEEVEQSREQLVEELEALRLRVRNLELARTESDLRVRLESLNRSIVAAGVGAWEWNRHTNLATWSDENFRHGGRRARGGAAQDLPAVRAGGRLLDPSVRRGGA